MFCQNSGQLNQVHLPGKTVGSVWISRPGGPGPTGMIDADSCGDVQSLAVVHPSGYGYLSRMQGQGLVANLQSLAEIIRVTIPESCNWLPCKGQPCPSDLAYSIFWLWLEHHGTSTVICEASGVPPMNRRRVVALRPVSERPSKILKTIGKIRMKSMKCCFPTVDAFVSTCFYHDPNGSNPCRSAGDFQLSAVVTCDLRCSSHS